MKPLVSVRAAVTKPERPSRVLMVAYACGPGRGSEPGVGWHRALEMAKHFEMWVIVEEHEFRDDIERYLREHGPIENLNFLFAPRMIASEDTWRWLSRIRPLYYSAYRRWQNKAYRLACELCEEVEFDIVHQSTMCGFREPGQLWRLNVPFVWGPVGGTQNYPWRFLPQAGIAGALKEGARSIINALQLRFNRRVQAACRRAEVLLTAIPGGQRDFRRIQGVNPTCMLDVGVNGELGQPRKYRGRRRPLRLLWSGVFGHHKALQLLLRALAELPDGFDYELRILGDGPLRGPWKRLARRLRVDGRCTWMGWLPHDKAMKQCLWADVFVFTSLRDTCGTVVLEALSRGLPVICLDLHGAGLVVNDLSGIKVPVTTPREVVAGLRNAIVDAGSDDRNLEVLSHGAIESAREYHWERHGERLAEIYRGVIKKTRSLSPVGPSPDDPNQAESP